MIHKLRILLTALFIFVAIGFAFQLTIDNIYTQRWIEKQINSFLDKNFDLKLRYNTFSVSLINPSVSIYGINLVQKQNDQSILEASRIKLTPYIIGIFIGEYKIDELDVLDLKIRLPIDSNKDSGLDETVKTKKIIWPPTWKFPANHIYLKNADIESGVRPRADQSSISYIIRGLNAEIDWNKFNDWTAKFEAKEVSLAHDEVLLISRAKVETKLIASKDWNIRSEYIKIDSKNLKTTQHLDLKVNLKEEQFDPISSLRPQQSIDAIKISLDGSVENAELSILGDFLKAENTYGKINGQTAFKMTIPFDDKSIQWRVDVEANSNNSVLSGFKLLQSDFKLEITQDTLKFKEINFKDHEHLLATAIGQINFDKHISMQYDVSVRNTSLVQLLDILKVEDFQTIEASLNSNSIRITGQANPFHLKIQGNAQAKAIHSPIVKSNLNENSLPTCDLNLLISLNSKNLAFVKNNGTCYPSAQKQDSSTTKTSKLFLDGNIALSQDARSDLKIHLPSTYPKLLNTFTPFTVGGTFESKIHYFERKKNHPIVDIIIRGNKLSITDTEFEHLDTKFYIDTHKTQVKVERFHLTRENQSIIRLFNSTIDYKKNHISGDLEIRDFSSDFFYAILGLNQNKKDLSVHIHNIQGFLDLDLNNLRHTKASISYNLKSLSFKNHNIFQSAAGSIKADDNEITMAADRVSKNSIQLKLKYLVKKSKTNKITDHWLFKHLGLSDDDHFTLEVSNTVKPIDNGSNGEPKYKEQSDLTALPFFGEFFQKSNGAGDLAIDLTMEGSPKDIKGRFSGSILNFFLNESPLASVYFSGFIDGTKINIPVIKHSGNSLTGRMTLDLASTDLPYSWNFYLNQFDLRALVGKSFSNDPRNYLYTSASISMSGKMDDWWNSSGILEINEVAMNYTNDRFGNISHLKIDTDEKIKLIMTPENWQFEDNKSLNISSNLLDLNVNLTGNNPPSNLSAEITSNLDLGLIKNLLPQIESAEGKVTLKAIVSKSVESPVIDILATNHSPDKNSAQESPLKLGVTGISPPFSNIKFDMQYRNGLLNINRFTANKGKQGLVKINGVIATEEEKTRTTRLFVDFENIEINQIQYNIFQNTNILASGNLGIEGNQTPFQLKGDVRIEKATSINDFDIRKEIVDALYSSRDSASIQEEQDLFDLDISIKADNSLYIRNKNIEATLAGDMIIQGSEKRPVIIGQITSSNGTFNYKQKFELKRSVISFEDPSYPPNPNLDIIGHTTIDNYNIEVSISGPASEPQVDFSIDPATRSDGRPISKVDIIMLLTSGKLPSQDIQSPIKIASSEALSLLVGFAEGPLEQIFDASGQSFIRQIYLDSYLSETESRPVTRLNLPVDINDDLRVILQVDDDENLKLSSQYYLHENIAVSGSFDKPKESKINESNRNLPTDTVIDLRFRFGFD